MRWLLCLLVLGCSVKFGEPEPELPEAPRFEDTHLGRIEARREEDRKRKAEQAAKREEKRQARDEFDRCVAAALPPKPEKETVARSPMYMAYADGPLYTHDEKGNRKALQACLDDGYSHRDCRSPIVRGEYADAEERNHKRAIEWLDARDQAEAVCSEQTGFKLDPLEKFGRDNMEFR